MPASEDNGQGKNSYIGNAYYCNHRNHDKRCKRCINGTPYCFLNGFIGYIRRFYEFTVKAFVGIELNILTHAVKYDYGVVNRVSENGNKRGNKRGINFDVEYSHKAYHYKNIMQKRKNRRNTA